MTKSPIADTGDNDGREVTGDPGEDSPRPGIRSVTLVGACVACCVPMLVVVGAVSVGAALAGAVGLAVLVALVATAVVVVQRFRRGR